MRRNSRNGIQVSLPDGLQNCGYTKAKKISPERAATFYILDSYNQTGGGYHSSKKLVWQELPTEIRKCVFNWQTNLQFLFLGFVWLGIIVAHIAIERIADLKKISSLNLRISYLLGPCLFLFILSLMRVAAFDLSLSCNSVCRKKVYELKRRIKEFFYYNRLERCDSVEEISAVVRPHFSFCNVILIVGAVLFIVSMTAFIVLECFSVGGLFHNMHAACLIALQSTLLAISFSSILTITALLLYKDQVTHAFELEKVEEIDSRRSSVPQYVVS
ncbi:hypothetical protein ACJZTR_00325 [Neorickettsia risticii]